ncbi:MAG: hypothetical protein ACLQVF_04175 [Isosphaeraceae bacterium]
MRRRRWQRPPKPSMRGCYEESPAEYRERLDRELAERIAEDRRAEAARRAALTPEQREREDREQTEAEARNRARRQREIAEAEERERERWQRRNDPFSTFGTRAALATGNRYYRVLSHHRLYHVLSLFFAPLCSVLQLRWNRCNVKFFKRLPIFSARRRLIFVKLKSRVRVPEVALDFQSIDARTPTSLGPAAGTLAATVSREASGTRRSAAVTQTVTQTVPKGYT